jgi:hypothetical protein
VSHRRMNLARMIALMMKDWTEPKRARLGHRWSLIGRAWKGASYKYPVIWGRPRLRTTRVAQRRLDAREAGRVLILSHSAGR